MHLAKDWHSRTVFTFMIAPRPPNADFRLLSSKELSEAEKETAAKPVTEFSPFILPMLMQCTHNEALSSQYQILNS